MMDSMILGRIIIETIMILNILVDTRKYIHQTISIKITMGGIKN